MKQLPEALNSFRPLLDLNLYAISARIYEAALDLSIFDELTEPVSSQTVARNLNTHPENTRLLLNGLASLGLVSLKKGLYRNTPVSQEYLLSAGDKSLLPLMKSAEMTMAGRLDVADLVRKGPPRASQDDVRDPDFWARVTRAQANYSRAGMAQIMVELISGLPEFPGFSSMLDLGGGSGMTSIGMVNAHPGMTSVVFDQAPVLEVTREFVNEYGLEDRISTMSGDYGKDPIGQGYDFVWASFTLNFFRYSLPEIMAKLHKALNPGGVLAVAQDGLTHERTQPAEMVLWGMGHALLGHDLLLDQGAVAEAMLEAGFQKVRSLSKDTPTGTVDIDLAWKAR